MIIGGMLAIEEKIGSEVADSTRRSNVKEMVGSVKGFHPEGGW